MTVAHVYTVAFQGIEAREVDVKVHVGEGGSGQFNLVGLADKAVAESKERVRAALGAIGLAMPYRRVTVTRMIPQKRGGCRKRIRLSRSLRPSPLKNFSGSKRATRYIESIYTNWLDLRALLATRF